MSFRHIFRRFSNATRRNFWTSDKVILSPFQDVEIPKTTIFDHVFKNLDRWSSQLATVCGLTNRMYTYEQIYKQSRTLAANLRRKFRLTDGDTVVLMLPNMPEFPIALFGILAAGGIVSPVNPLYTPYELQRHIDISEAKLIIAHPDLVPNVRIALELAKKDIKIISVNVDKDRPDGTICYKELVIDDHVDLTILNEVKRAHDDIAFLPFSSGTTGLPKAVEVTNENMVTNFEQQNTEFRQYEFTTDSHQDTTLAILPMFHFYGLAAQMLHKMSVGLKLVTLPKFTPDTFLNALLEHKIDIMYLAPPTILFFASHAGVTARHLQHIRLVVSAAAPLPSADIHKFLDKANHEIGFYQCYGFTEGGPVITLTPVGEKHYMEVGYALPNIKMRVVDSELRNLGPGELGELLIKGRNIMKGYKNNIKLNEEVLVDGWFRSGDLVKIDENGLLTIVDRLKELIKVKGYQVPPAELEGVLKEHPGVHDAAVVGIPDPKAGEIPKAFVVLKQDTNVSDKEIMKFVSDRVAPYKMIKEVSFIDTIPRNVSGKILRKMLRNN